MTTLGAKVEKQKRFHLKKIQIFGFKSFADKSSLDFHEGITAIVGPNGCGKSNIADAFRWVLGEQSAKSMRGNKMPDVIFAGTTARKPLNFAEVTLTFTNPDRALPIDYEEVALTRRLHRSGESDYFINRNPVRLKDTQDLFLDSGIGRNAFAIFEQGKIDQVIQYSPLERRFIFEEAAGILRFLQRKKEAHRKLEQLDQNIVRIQDIHKELEKQISILEEQAEVARTYKTNKNSLEFLEKGLFCARYDIFHKKQKEMANKESECKKTISDLQSQLVELHHLFQKEQENLKKVDASLRTKQEEIYQMRSQKEIRSKEKQHTLERLEDSLNKEKRWKQEIETTLEKRYLWQQEAASLKQKLKPKEQELRSYEANFKKKKENFQKLEEELQQLREKQHKITQNKLKGLEVANQIDSQNKQQRFRFEANQEKKEHLQTRHVNLLLVIKQIEQELEKKKRSFQDISQEIEKERQNFLRLDLEFKKISESIEEEQESFDHFQTNFAECKAHHKALCQMQKNHEGFSLGSKKILQEASLPESPLYQKVQELYRFFTPKENFETLFGMAMRPYAQTLAVLSWDDFFTVISFAENHAILDFSLVCLEGLEKTKEPSLPNSLTFCMEEGAYNAHFLNHFFLAKELREIKFIKGSFFLFEKSFVDSNAVFFSETSTENPLFKRESEIKALGKKLQEEEEKRLIFEEKLRTLRSKKTFLQSERMESDQKIRKQEIGLVEANFALQKVKQDVEKSHLEKSQIEEEIQMLDASLKEIEKELSQGQKKHAEALAHFSSLQNDHSLVESGLAEKLEAWKKAQDTLKEEETFFEVINDEVRKLSHAINLLDVKDQESQRQQLRLEEELQLSIAYRDQLKQKHVHIDITELEKELEEVQKEHKTLETEEKSIQAKIKDLDLQAKEKQEKLKESEKTAYHYNIQMAQSETGMQTLLAQLEERYQTNIEDLKEKDYKLEKSIEATEKEVRHLRQALEGAGNVNLASIDECEKLKERDSFFKTQMGDIHGSKEELLQIITELDNQSRKIFKETFLKIQENFKRNFQILFSGGEADLELTDAKDLLEAGIEISAKPPGKQMRSIQLLSGGEKCLTAMALLFAIFEVKPSPFCILDEIDAPLDDSNVERFLNVVRQFIDRCQFIIITHNKRTMAIADRIYGISMEEKGVSKLLCMEFQNENSPNVKIEMEEPAQV